MPKILVVWEMGAGLGHIARVGRLCAELVERGHDVTAALRSNTAAASFFPDNVALIDATPAPAPRIPAPPTHTLPDVLCAHDWGNPEVLLARVASWRTLISQHRPDHLVLDYAPSTLLAAQGLSIPITLLDTGFTCPPDVTPLPDLQPPGESPPSEASLANEHAALAAANTVLAHHREPPLDYLAQLWHARVDARVLATFPELDHYEHRQSRVDFVGPWWHSVSEPPAWPDADGPRVFAYLKPFPALPALLKMLSASKLPCLVYASGNAASLAKDAASATLTALASPVDTTRVIAEAQLAILHSGAALSGGFLAKGVPAMHIPRSLEQFPTARRVSDLGAGRIADAKAADTLAPALTDLLTDPAYTHAAQRFARTKADWTPESSLQAAADRIVRGLV